MSNRTYLSLALLLLLGAILVMIVGCAQPSADDVRQVEYLIAESTCPESAVVHAKRALNDARFMMYHESRKSMLLQDYSAASEAILKIRHYLELCSYGSQPCQSK